MVSRRAAMDPDMLCASCARRFAEWRRKHPAFSAEEAIRDGWEPRVSWDDYLKSLDKRRKERV